MVEGNTQHRYKEALTSLEESSPGTKQQMYFGFLARAADRFARADEAVELVPCSRCGAPTTAGAEEPLCSFCRTKDLANRRRASGGAGRGSKRRAHVR